MKILLFLIALVPISFYVAPFYAFVFWASLLILIFWR